jgi:mRNA-degrading endonuclease RelE of RelBE toxin-antitoxin system
MNPYTVWLEPDVHAARKDWPGNIRQRLRRILDDFATNPRLADSQTMDTTGLELPPAIELRRLRLQHWRVIYAVNDAEAWVWVLAVRQRPPYDYEDLGELADRLK